MYVTLPDDNLLTIELNTQMNIIAETVLKVGYDH